MARVSSLDPRTVKKAMECELLQNELVFEARKGGLYCTHPRVLQTLQDIELEQERRAAAQKARRERENGQPALPANQQQKPAEMQQTFAETQQRFAENEQTFAENEQRFAENEQTFAETCTEAVPNSLKNNETAGQVCAQVVVIKEEKRRENIISTTTTTTGPGFPEFLEFWTANGLRGGQQLASKCWDYWSSLNWLENRDGQQLLVDWRKKAINWARTERPEAPARQPVLQQGRAQRQGFNSAAVLGSAVAAMGVGND